MRRVLARIGHPLWQDRQFQLGWQLNFPAGSQRLDQLEALFGTEMDGQ